MSPYAIRIVLTSLVLALLTGALIWHGPQVGDVRLIAQHPNGDAISTATTIRMTFSRPVDPQSAVQHVQLLPPVAGQFSWQGATLTFRPGKPLNPATRYHVLVRAGLRDAQGRINRTEPRWSFQTRSPILLIGTLRPEGGSRFVTVTPSDAQVLDVATLPDTVLAASVAPDQEQVVLTVERGPRRTALVMLNLVDGSTRPLVDDPEQSASDAAWAPSGDLIAYARRPLLGDTRGQARIWLAQPDGTTFGPLLSSEVLGVTPVWSPDGGRIAFVSGPGTALGIYNFFRDSQQMLPAGTGEPPGWAPNSRTLVYSVTGAGAPGATTRLLRYDLEREAATALTDGQAHDQNPTWSPDGQQIAFVRQHRDRPGSSVWIMAADGTGQRQISNSGHDLMPAWSPDGRQIAFLRALPDGSNEVWVVDRTGSELRRVYTGAALVLWLS